MSAPNDHTSPPSGQVTRRELIGIGVGAGAGLALGAVDDAAARGAKTNKPKPTRRARRADVVVVGAGAAGCAAAHAVAKAGRSVILVEARDRVGGRTENHDLGNGKLVEIGGTFVGPTQEHVFALLSEFNRGTFKTYDIGKTVTRVNGRSGPPVGAGIEQVIKPMDETSKHVPTGAPWTSPNAAKWDGQTLETFGEQHVHSAVAKSVLNALSAAVWGAPPQDVSLLFALFYVGAAGSEKSPGNWHNLIATTGGAQEQRVIGGTQALFTDIAASLPGRVVLSAPVRRIGQDGKRMTVVSDRASFSASQVIVAVAPALAGRIFYEPHLPALRDQLTQRFPMGSYAKVECFYDTPFWREDGLNGQVLTDELVGLSWDQSPPDGSPGIIAAFIGGNQARRWDRQSPAARKQGVLDALAKLFGARAAKPTDYLEKRWTADEVWSRGGPTGFAPPGVLTGFGPALREPRGRIKWASTESAEFWAGYIEGAIRSGQRAAGEVLADL